MYAQQEIQSAERAHRAGLLFGNHELDRRLNATIVKAVLKELESLLLDTEKLTIRYKLTFQATSFSKAAASHPGVASADSILGVAVSDETREDILFQAHLVQDRDSFP